MAAAGFFFALVTITASPLNFHRKQARLNTTLTNWHCFKDKSFCIL